MDRHLTPALAGSLVADYAALGEHRTGSPGDAATSRWLVEWLGARGVAAREEPFAYPKLTCRAAYVQIGEARVEGTPLYDGGATGASGLEAPIASDGIALVEGADASLAGLAGRARGAVLLSGDPEGYVQLRNAEHMGSPLALPVLQVAERDSAPLRTAAAAGRQARLVVDFDVGFGEATNVVAEIPGSGGGGRVVLMTPKSGWFRCAAERGGGVAIGMALAAHAARMPGRRSALRLLFTSGHELGHRGLLRHLEGNPGLRAEAGLWVQLGASIGARQPTGTRMFSREDAWRAWFPPVLERHGALPFALADKHVRPGGESREVFEHPFVALAGHHAWFHSPRDLPEVAADGAHVARFGRAFAELMERALV